MAPWRATHSRVSSAASITRPSSFLLKRSRLVVATVLAAVLLTTYCSELIDSHKWGSSMEALGVEVLDDFDLQGGQSVMDGRNASDDLPLGSPDPYETAEHEEEAQATLAAEMASLPDKEDYAADKLPTDLAVSPEPGTAMIRKTLPICKRTILFRFAGLHGFGSEVTLLLRIAALAEHFGYSLFLDSTAWNYGLWNDYFLPFSSPFPLSSSSTAACRPPREGSVKRYKLVLTTDELLAATSTTPSPPFIPKWTQRNHISWHARDMDGVDLSILRLLVDQSDLGILHSQDLRRLAAGKTDPVVGFLGPQETVPPAFEEALGRLSELAEVLWRPNEEVLSAASELEQRLGLPATRSVSEEKTLGDLLVAVHVRLGDKFLEADRIGPIAYAPDAVAASSPSSSSSSSAPPGLHDSLISSYFAAAIDSVNSILSLPSVASVVGRNKPSSDRAFVRLLSSATEGWYELSDADGGRRPTLVLMSDDEAAVEAFKRHPLAPRFRIIGTAGEDTPTVTVTTSPTVDESEGSATEEEAEDEVEVEELKKRGVGARDGGKRMAVVVKPQARSFGHAHKMPVGVKWHKAPFEEKKTLVPAGFNEATFNALPLASRLSSTRLFVRDLTVLCRRADAIVMTGSSNVGRLMTLLFEAGRRERGERGKREVRSLDTRWFPTARFS
ncbi:hypothetical protein JCM11251_007870 [Rhodosporidiobolus azoricus]